MKFFKLTGWLPKRLWRVVVPFGLYFLQSHRPFSQTSRDAVSGGFFLLFFILGIVVFTAPIVTLIIGFVSRRARCPWFIVPFAITALFGIFHTVTGLLDFATQGVMPGSFYWGCAYTGVALVSLVAYNWRRVESNGSGSE